MRPIERGSDQRSVRRNSSSSAARRRDGKLSIIAIPWIVGMLVLTGLVGNSGQTAVQKIEVQNAADAAAYSTALWQARGLNAITTSNHLAGEFASFVILHEALGGPELDNKTSTDTQESQEMHSKLQQLFNQGPAHIGTDDIETQGTNTFAFYGDNFDKRVVDEIVQKILDTEMVSGATIYDGRLTLMSCAILLVEIKLQANVVARIGTLLKKTPFAGIGLALESAAFGVHVAATLELIVVGKEWIVLNVFEEVGHDTAFMKGTIRNTILPALNRYSDLVAGRIGVSPVNSSVTRSLNSLRSSDRVDALTVFPRPEIGISQTLKLPVETEPTPAGTGNSSRPESQWSGRDPALGAMAPIRNLLNNKWIDKVETILDFLSALNDLSPIQNFGGISTDISAIKNALPYHDKRWPENPSWDGLPEFDWQAERRSQLTRSAYPYVDAYRRSIRQEWMEEAPWSPTGIPTSMAAQYYAHWTNRYTVTESFRRRQDGFKMYVLQDMTPEIKGNERWVSDDSRAEDLFTVIAIARRSRKPPTVLPGAFKDANKTDVVTMSQAITYNANGRELNGNQQRQPNTGWDTLNWNPVVQAPEWGDHDPGHANGRLLFDIFRGRSPVSATTTRVKLNWQAKLVPVTKTRLSDAVNGNLGDGMKQPLQSVLDHFDLATH